VKVDPAEMMVSPSNRKAVSPAKSLPVVVSGSTSAATSASASPTKGRGRGRIWDSLWQLDISLEGGKKK
jgi:hypothetical protein